MISGSMEIDIVAIIVGNFIGSLFVIKFMLDKFIERIELNRIFI